VGLAHTQQHELVCINQRSASLILCALDHHCSPSSPRPSTAKMKVSTSLALLAAAGANAHYTFASTIYNGARAADWTTVRLAQNKDSNGPVTDLNSGAMTCYEMNPGQGAPQTLGVGAGSTVTIAVGGGQIFHPGPLHAYLAKVPSGKTAKNFDAKGAVWFKIYQDGPSGFGTGNLKWPSDSTFTFTLTIPTSRIQGLTNSITDKGQVAIPIPRCVESGEYLLRVEHIALHGAGAVGGAQLYLSCAQLAISNGSGGIKTPALVSFPGAYKATDPGIQYNLYNNPRSYVNPGPALATC